MRSSPRTELLGQEARNYVERDDSFTQLTVEFTILHPEPGYLSGVAFTCDSGATYQEVLATFQGFEGERGVWRAQVRVSGLGASFDYVIFHRAPGDARRVKPDEGEPFHIVGRF